MRLKPSTAGPRTLSVRLRRAATFPRKIGIDITFDREERARTRTVTITANRDRAPESQRAQPSAPSAPSASTPRLNATNGFATARRRTIAEHADGRERGADPTVRTSLRKERRRRSGRKSPRSIWAAKNERRRLERANMSAAEAITPARAAGIQIMIDGDDLLLQALAPPRRSSICCPATSLASWRCCGTARTTGRPRISRISSRRGPRSRRSVAARRESKAETRAFVCCIVEWLNRNPVRSPPGGYLNCLNCHGGDHAHDPLLPHGIEPTGHACPHSRCWPAWYARRKAEAVDALTAIGIAMPVEFPNDFEKNGGE
jgi:hypothetical protein